MGSQTQLDGDGQEKPGMEACIREWADQVNDVLGATGPMSLAGLARRINDASTNEVAMAVGWLARAGKIRFKRREELWEISLQD